MLRLLVQPLCRPSKPLVQKCRAKSTFLNLDEVLQMVPLCKQPPTTEMQQTEQVQQTLAPLQRAVARREQRSSPSPPQISLVDGSRLFKKTETSGKIQRPESHLARPITLARPDHQANIATRSIAKTFAEMSIPAWLVESLSCQNIQQPTRVQQKTIEAFLEHAPGGRKPRPLLIRGQTGTGKSLGYIISALSRMHLERKTKSLIELWSCVHLIVVPNAILALQLYRWIASLVKPNAYLSGNVTEVVRLMISEHEAVDLEEQHPGISKPGFSHILIGVPSLIRTAMAKGLLNISTVKNIIVDEADGLIKPLSAYATLKERLNRTRHPVPVISLLKEVQSTCREYKVLHPRLIVASASLNRRTKQELVSSGLLTGSYTLVQDSTSTPTCPAIIKHYHRVLADSGSVEELVQLVNWIWQQHDGQTGVVFLPSGRSKVAVQQWLKASGIKAHLLSALPTGNQDSLQQLVDTGSVLLVGSDVDARGWDLPMLRYVIIVDLPESPTHYLHMAGRVGRMGSPGEVYTIVAGQRDFERLTSIHSLLRVTSVPYLSID